MSKVGIYISKTFRTFSVSNVPTADLLSDQWAEQLTTNLKNVKVMEYFITVIMHMGRLRKVHCPFRAIVSK